MIWSTVPAQNSASAGDFDRFAKTPGSTRKKSSSPGRGTIISGRRFRATAHARLGSGPAAAGSIRSDDVPLFYCLIEATDFPDLNAQSPSQRCNGDWVFKYCDAQSLRLEGSATHADEPHGSGSCRTSTEGADRKSVICHLSSWHFSGSSP